MLKCMNSAAGTVCVREWRFYSLMLGDVCCPVARTEGSAFQSEYTSWCACKKDFLMSGFECSCRCTSVQKGGEVASLMFGSEYVCRYKNGHSCCDDVSKVITPLTCARHDGRLPGLLNSGVHEEVNPHILASSRLVVSALPWSRQVRSQFLLCVNCLCVFFW